MPEAIKNLNFTTEQLPVLDENEGYVPKAEEVKGEETSKEKEASKEKEVKLASSSKRGRRRGKV